MEAVTSGASDNPPASPTDGNEETAPLGEITAAMLRATFDRWRIFEDSGFWWALRGGQVCGSGPRSLIRPAVFSRSLDRLGDMLSFQEWLRGLSDAELELVWRDGPAAVEE